MKNTLIAALVAAAFALPAFGQATPRETAKLEAGQAKAQAKDDKAKATPKEGAKLAKAQGKQKKKSKKAATPKREAKAAG